MIRFLMYKLLCACGLHELKHDYSCITESTLTIVMRCKHCDHTIVETTPRIDVENT